MASKETESFEVDGYRLILERWIYNSGRPNLNVTNDWSFGNERYISLKVRKKWPWHNEAQAILYTARLVIRDSKKRMEYLMSQTLSGKVSAVKEETRSDD